MEEQVTERDAALDALDAALGELGRTYRVELRRGAWDAKYFAWGLERVAYILDRLTGWRPPEEGPDALWLAIDAACALWLVLRRSAKGNGHAGA